MPLRFSNALSVFICLICFYIGNAKSNVLNNELTEIANTADEIAHKYHQQGWFSGTLLLAKNGKVFHSSSFGLENVKTKSPNTIATKFNLGSIVKNFTKVLVLQKIELGQLQLTDTLDKFDLGFPEQVSSTITIEHLLNHRSGFEDIFIAQYRENQLAFDTLEKKLALLKNRPLLFEPGTDHRYSNYGYVVLGAILEKVSKSSYEQLLNKNIFERIHLKNTSLKVESFAKGQSVRYTYLYDSSIKEVGVTEHPGPAGGIESTVEDVQKFYRELFYGNKLLTQTNPVNIKAFAMDGEHWGSYGGGAGVSTAIEVDLVDNIEIVVLANTDNLVAELISGRVLSYIKKGTYEPIKPLEMNFAYNYYKEKGKDKFYNGFKDEYKQAGYSQFIGRVINELGMQLLVEESWHEAFDIMNYLKAIFPNAPQAYDSLAFAHYTKGEFKKAEQAFQKAQALKPGFNSDYISSNYAN
ncbi:serine hydrolase [Colwellia piezophila]|uniref:serine hydrolase n=1 Tax=Colwellia piezophila TaxID=211668 RepID=UPI00035E42B6|nr:serine hydrolase [Colwellia piezophila]